ncbi:MAG: dihydroorotate dehydrogenase [Candidatus Aminicenantia bacterium]
MVDLSVNLGFIKLKNPILTASGTFGYGIEFSHFYDLSILGGIITKGIFMDEVEGNPPPRIWETTSGMLNSIGLQGIGAERFAEEILPELRKYDTHIIVNVCGHTDEEYAKVASYLSKEKGISAFELNISCPNIHKNGLCPAMDPEWTYRIVKIVKNETDLPLIVKLSPNVSDIASVALSCEDGGADAISMINTILAMAVDWRERKPRLGNIMGGLSGPAIKPVALRMVFQAVRKVKIPVIGIGGIMTGEDVMEFLVTGAKAVEVGTANLIEPNACERIIKELEGICKKEGIEKIEDIIGTLKI